VFWFYCVCFSCFSSFSIGLGVFWLRVLGVLLVGLVVFGFVVGVEGKEVSFDVSPASYYYTSFTLASSASVHIVFKVLSGPAVDFLLLDESNFQLFKSQIDEGYYQVDSYLTLQNVRSFDRSVSLGSGKYYIVVVNWDLFDTATCSLMYEAEGGGSAGGLLVLIMVVVGVVLVGLFLYRRR